MLKNNIQVLLQEAGESGCYALCLIDVAASYMNYTQPGVVEALIKGIDSGCIYYNDKDPNDNDNFYVKDPARFLTILTGRRWSVRKEVAGYKAQKSEYVINRWERTKTGSIIGHFERDVFKPIRDSLTVKYGSLVSTRVCTVY